MKICTAASQAYRVLRKLRLTEVWLCQLLKDNQVTKSSFHHLLLGSSPVANNSLVNFGKLREVTEVHCRAESVPSTQNGIEQQSWTTSERNYLPPGLSWREGLGCSEFYSNVRNLKSTNQTLFMNVFAVYVGWARETELFHLREKLQRNTVEI